MEPTGRKRTLRDASDNDDGRAMALQPLQENSEQFLEEATFDFSLLNRKRSMVIS